MKKDSIITLRCGIEQKQKIEKSAKQRNQTVPENPVKARVSAFTGF